MFMNVRCTYRVVVLEQPLKLQVVRGASDDSLRRLKVDTIDVGLPDDATVYCGEDHIQVGFRRAVKSRVIGCCHRDDREFCDVASPGVGKKRVKEIRPDVREISA